MLGGRREDGPSELPPPSSKVYALAIVVSWSEISSYRQCPHKHLLQYKQRWTKPNPANSALNKGTLWHKVVEVYYTSQMHGNDKATALADARREIHDYRVLGIDSEVLDLIEWMLEGYHRRWAFDSEWDWEVLAVEQRFQLPLRTASGRHSGFVLKGGIDLIVRDRSNGRVSLIDHKTCANLPKDLELELNDQFALYLWAMRQLKDKFGYRVFNAIHNAVRTTRNNGDYPEKVAEWHRVKAAGGKPGAQPKPQQLEGRFSRYLMDRTDKELDTVAAEALATVRQAYSKSNTHQRHPDQDRCRWMCSYTEACLIGRKLTDERETRFLLDTGHSQDFRRH